MASILPYLAQHWALVLFFAAVGTIVFLARATVSETDPPYGKRRAVLGDLECRIFKALQGAVGGSWLILPHVPLSELVQVLPETPGKAYWRDKLQGHWLDFVLCHPESLEGLLVIELEQTTSPLVASYLAAAGVPLLKIPSADQYDKITLRKSLDEALAQNKK